MHGGNTKSEEGRLLSLSLSSFSEKQTLEEVLQKATKARCRCCSLSLSLCRSRSSPLEQFHGVIALFLLFCFLLGGGRGPLAPH